jgi:GPH family glycoside/pentoside/hexuronide:cation symporter
LSAVANRARESAAGNRDAFRFTPARKSLYAFGDVADGIKNTAIGTFLLFYLTAVCGLSGSMAGAAIAITLTVDAIADPLIGYISDNTRSRWGRRHPYLFGGALPFAIAFGMLFSVPKLESMWAVFAYVTIVLIVLRVAFSTFVLPYAAVGAELASDYTERSVVMTYRNFANICANVSCVVLGFGVFMSGDNGLITRDAYVPFGWTLAAIVLVATLICATSTLSLRPHLMKIAPASRSATARLRGELRDVFRNRSFVVLFLTVVVFWVAQGTAGNLSVHAFRYFWSLSPDVIQRVLIAGTVGLTCGIPVCAWLLRRFEKRDVAAIGLALICLCLFLPPTLRISGLLQADGAALQAVLAAFQWTIGCISTCVSVSFGSMMMDAADEHEQLFAVRREALYFAGLLFAAKCAIGIGALVGGISLDLIGFPSDIAANPTQVIPSDTIRELGLIYGPGASCISALCVVILVRYRLTRAALDNIQRELVARRARITAAT